MTIVTVNARGNAIATAIPTAVTDVVNHPHDRATGNALIGVLLAEMINTGQIASVTAAARTTASVVVSWEIGLMTGRRFLPC